MYGYLGDVYMSVYRLAIKVSLDVRYVQHHKQTALCLKVFECVLHAIKLFTDLVQASFMAGKEILKTFICLKVGLLSKPSLFFFF